MEYNKEEAKRLIEIAERKISENDYNEAKQFVNKAQSLYPTLDGLNQVLMIIDVYISASNGTREEADCYKILGVDSFADEEEVKKQYKKLALSLHPDKNKFNGAEGAFKLVSEAWCMLTNKGKKTSSNETQNPRDGVDPTPRAKKARSNKNTPVDSSKQRKVDLFWTMCNKCKTQCVYLREKYLNKAILCPNCRQTFIATENGAASYGIHNSSAQKTTQASVKSQEKNKKTNGASSQQQQQQWSTAQNTSGGTCSKRYSSAPVSFQFNCSMSARSNSGKAASQGQKISKRRLEELGEVFPFAEKILKKPRTDVR